MQTENESRRSMDNPRLSLSPNEDRMSLDRRSLELLRHEAEGRRSLQIERENNPTRMSIDAAPTGIEMKMKHEQIQEKKKKGEKLTREELKKEVDIDEHKKEPQQVLSDLQTNRQTGLTEEEAKFRFDRDGPNALTPPKQTSLFLLFLHELFGGFQGLLWAAAVLALIAFLLDKSVLDNIYIIIVLMVVIWGTAILTFTQQLASAKVMAGFAESLAESARVLRNGEFKNVSIETLVVGDIVEIKSGEVTPADLLVLESSGLKVDNSSLTGESEAQERIAQHTHDNPLESKNLMFNSTQVVEGKGIGVVIRVGDHTVIGHIAGLVAGSKKKKSTLRAELDRFVLIIAGIAITCGVIFIAIAFGRIKITHATVVTKTILLAMGIVIGAVPEGLLPTLAIGLRLTAKRMKNKQILVKNLEAIETLGCISIICSDKTGTLTQNKMTVSHLWYNNKISSNHKATQDYPSFEKDSLSFLCLHRVANLCNSTTFDQSEADQNIPIEDRKCLGDASETALVRFCHVLRDIYEHRDANPIVCEIPFNSTNKFALSIRRMESNPQRFVLVMKGAPEIILTRCSTYVVERGEQVLFEPLDETFRTNYDQTQDILSGFGERVLGFAQLELDPAQYPEDYKFETSVVNFPLEGLTFCGLISLIDPPKLSVPNSIEKCHEAKIKVIMVTGDHPKTAAAIAKQIGIITGESNLEVSQQLGCQPLQVTKDQCKAVVVAGGELKEMDDEELKRVLGFEEIVFARTSPQQKLRIVECCQALGNITAVTGDGVNDSPALKTANIGCAMGISGSAVSKQAADIVLLDDNFSSIVHGIEEGRLIFDNLKKSILYKLTANSSELLPFFFYVLGDIPLPLTTLLILAIDVGADMWPAIAMAYELPEPDLMARGPRNPKTENLVNAKLITYAYGVIGLIQAIAACLSFIWVLSEASEEGNGFPPSSVWGLREDFEYLEPDSAENYTICRIQQREYQNGDYVLARKFIACNESVEVLDNLTSAVLANFSNDVHSAINAGIFVDYCFNEDEINKTLSCQWSNTWPREELLKKAHSIYFIVVIQLQWACLLIAKTRKVSLFTQGLHNWVLNFGWLFETCLAVFLVFTPGVQIFMGTSQPKIEWLCMFFPWFLLIFFTDEIRKFFVRRYGNDSYWVRHTYY